MSSETEITFLVLGTRLSAKDKRMTLLQPVDENLTPYGPPSTFAYNPKIYRGNIYRCKGILEDWSVVQYQPSNCQFVASLPDGDERTEIILEHEREEDVYTAFQKAKKAKNDKDSVLECLKPIRRIYHTTNATGKLALELRVLNYLRNGRDL